MFLLNESTVTPGGLTRARPAGELVSVKPVKILLANRKSIKLPTEGEAADLTSPFHLDILK